MKHCIKSYIVAFIEDSLLTPGCGLTHHGENPDDKEMTPTLENLIVLIWLKLIHPDLPKMVKERFGTELRMRTLASIKTEIFQSLPSMLQKLNAPEDSSIRFTKHTTRTQPSSAPECPICKAAKKRNFNHFLSKCQYLPEEDRRYFVRNKPKTRTVTVDVPVSDTDADSDSDVDREDPSSEGLVWFGLCCLMTPGLSKDIRCHV